MKVWEKIGFAREPFRCELRPPFASQEPPVPYFLAMLLFTVAFYTQLGERLEFLGEMRFELLLGLVLLGMSIFVLLIRPPQFARERAFVFTTVLFILALALQVPLALDAETAANTFSQWVIKNILFGLFIAALIRSPRHLIAFIGAFLFSMFWVYQEAVRGLISGSLVWYNQGIPRLHGGVPLYGHPNGLSLVACYSLPFIFQLLPLWRRVFPINLFLLATLIMAGLCIINTGSRAGYVGTVALIPYWILDARRKSKRLLMVLLVGAMVLPLMPDQYIGRFESIRGGDGSGEDSRQARIQLLRDAWAIWQENPLGLGIDGFERMRLERFGRGQDTHNLYTQVATHLGIQGLLVFLAFTGLMFAVLTRSLKRIQAVRNELTALFGHGRGGRARGGAELYAREVMAVEAIIRATRMLLFFILVNGAFAHTLYMVVWWFLAGLTLVESGLAFQMAQRMAANRDAVLAKLDRQQERAPSLAAPLAVSP